MQKAKMPRASRTEAMRAHREDGSSSRFAPARAGRRKKRRTIATRATTTAMHITGRAMLMSRDWAVLLPAVVGVLAPAVAPKTARSAAARQSDATALLRVIV